MPEHPVHALCQRPAARVGARPPAAARLLHGRRLQELFARPSKDNATLQAAVAAMPPTVILYHLQGCPNSM